MPARAARLRLTAIVALACVLRIVAAGQPGYHHPDAIFQYLEPAHRLLTGDGVVTWEWRAGGRSWMLPALLAPPLALAGIIDPGGAWNLLLPRAAIGIASLGIVWSAWTLGARHSPATALLAGLVAATWFEFVHFGVQTLAEPAATSAFLVAATLATTSGRSDRTTIVAGALFGLAAMLRPHYAPACAIVALAVAWRDRRTLLCLLLGGAVAAAFAGVVDGAQRQIPFRWIVANLWQNVGEARADRYGVSPPGAYLLEYLSQWQWMAPAILIGAVAGARREPAIAAAAVVTLALHSLIGHKEYRFVFLTTAVVIVLAAIGWGELVERAAQRWRPGRRAVATGGAIVLWSAASLSLADEAPMRRARTAGAAGTILADAVRRDPAACGLAILGPSVLDVPGTVSLRRDQALFWVAATRRQRPSPLPADAAVGFNRIVTLPRWQGLAPAGFRPMTCRADGQDRLCLLGRAGGCTRRPADPLAINAALRRAGI